ncbi:MAG: phosphodiester glycosidase family protein [Ginsengibacter sp.]|jgi:exopolysaccharide biosynthesis protein
MKIGIGIFTFILLSYSTSAQINWQNIDSLYQPLPTSMHVFKSTDSIGDSSNVMYYTIVDLKDESLLFTADTTQNRRFTPQQFFEKNNGPLLVVNTSFFSYATNQSLNVVVKEGRVVCYNEHSIPRRGKDTLTFSHSFFGALGISKKRNADIAWVLSDSSHRVLYASQTVIPHFSDSVNHIYFRELKRKFKKWKMQTVVGGGPVLIQENEVKISNNEELKFPNKGLTTRHPRTAIGYTNNGQLIIFVCEGRSETARGLDLLQMAKILQEIGCKEALNLDGGGSSCLLINGRQVNNPSDKEGQRAVPSVFMIERK